MWLVWDIEHIKCVTFIYLFFYMPCTRLKKRGRKLVHVNMSLRLRPAVCVCASLSLSLSLLAFLSQRHLFIFFFFFLLLLATVAFELASGLFEEKDKQYTSKLVWVLFSRRGQRGEGKFLQKWMKTERPCRESRRSAVLTFTLKKSSAKLKIVEHDAR